MDARAKIARHNRRLADHKPIVFCAACGSTMVDQWSLTLIRCSDCGNEAPWDATHFGIRRGDDEIGAADVDDHLCTVRCVSPPSPADADLAAAGRGGSR